MLGFRKWDNIKIMGSFPHSKNDTNQRGSLRTRCTERDNLGKWDQLVIHNAQPLNLTQ